jgi:methylglutamate dehydrogenase subunit D
LRKLSPRTGLEGAARPGHRGGTAGLPGVSISSPRNLELAIVMARAGKQADLLIRSRERFGVALPTIPRREFRGPLSFAWAGPRKWLAMLEGAWATDFERNLQDVFAGLASVTKQSDGLSVMRVGGPKARQALAKGVPLDLDARSFHVGDTALTVVGHIHVHFWQIDETPTYEFAVFRSFAVAFHEWLLEASIEFEVRTGINEATTHSDSTLFAK